MILLVLGLVFGSFITALSWRYPRGISNIRGRSFCDECKHEISWYENIPLFSYIFLGGKCKHCGKHISIRYPLIEIVSAISFYLIGWNILYLAIYVILASIFVIDFEHQIIPDAFIFAGIFLVHQNFLAGFIAACFLLSLHLITKGKGMGLGDVKFAVLAGMIIGLNLLPIWFFVAFLTGGLVGSILILGKIAKLKDKIAFGPFLVAAIPITLIWGEKIMTLMGLR